MSELLSLFLSVVSLVMMVEACHRPANLLMLLLLCLHGGSSFLPKWGERGHYDRHIGISIATALYYLAAAHSGATVEHTDRLDSVNAVNKVSNC